MIKQNFSDSDKKTFKDGHCESVRCNTEHSFHFNLIIAISQCWGGGGGGGNKHPLFMTRQ